MKATTLKEALTILEKAVCPEDVFGDPDGGTFPAFLKTEYNAWAKLTYEDFYHNAKEKKMAHEAFTLLQKWHKVAVTKIADGTYGKRDAISKITIKTKTDVYTVTERVASGDICEIYGATNKAGKRVVLKVTRTPANNDLVSNECTQLRLFTSDTVTAKLQAMDHIPNLLDSFELTQAKIKKRVNVFERQDGYVSMQDVIDAFPDGLNPQDAAWMWNRLLTALVITRRVGLVHGAVLPRNVAICPSNPHAHNAVLNDWCYAVKKGGVIRAIVPQEKDSYPPEVLAKKPAVHSTDIYMAALCMIRLLGGSVDKSVKIPDSVPRPIRGLLKSCLLSVAHRPKDAFEVFDEFNKILKQLYGPRKYRPFAMPAAVAA